MSRGQISRFLFSSTTLVFLESTLWQETDLISLSAKWPCVQIVLNVRFKQIRITCGVKRALMYLEIQISIPFPCMENRISDIQDNISFYVSQIKEKNTHNMRQTTATDDKKS